MVVSESGGRWARATEVTATVKGARPPSILAGIACPAARLCVSVGASRLSAGQYSGLAAVSWNGISWAGANAGRLPGNAARVGAKASLWTNVACTSERFCETVGYYRDNAGALRAMAAHS